MRGDLHRLEERAEGLFVVREEVRVVAHELTHPLRRRQGSARVFREKRPIYRVLEEIHFNTRRDFS